MKASFPTPCALVVTLLLGGCYPKAGAAPEAVTPVDVEKAASRWPGANAEALAHGRELFLAKCNNCHGYPDRNAVDEPRWPAIVKRMGAKAKLSPADGDHVLHFILATRTAPPASK